MLKTGRELQDIVRAIEAALSSGQNVKVESPKRLPDRVNPKRTREHDVLLTYTLEHHELCVALECRDRSRPVGVDAVEAFSRKCEDTGIHRGIIVSAKGFTKTALRKAEFYNMGCLSLDEAHGFDWCGTPGMEYKARHIDHTHCRISFPEGTDQSLPILTADGVLAKDRVNTWAANVINNSSDNLPFDVGTYRVRFHIPKLEVFAGSGERRVQADFAVFDIAYTVKVDIALFRFRKYTNTSTTTSIAEAAIATLPIGGDKTAEIVLSKGKDGITVTMVPQNSKAISSSK